MELVRLWVYRALGFRVLGKGSQISNRGGNWGLGFVKRLKYASILVCIPYVTEWLSTLNPRKYPNWPEFLAEDTSKTEALDSKHQQLSIFNPVKPCYKVFGPF